jgi:hypothetical protein
MTNIIEKSKPTDVHVHIDKAYKVIDEHLPADYTKKVLEKAKDKTLTAGVIRNIRYRVTLYPKTRINILNILLELSLENKKAKEHLAKLVK